MKTRVSTNLRNVVRESRFVSRNFRTDVRDERKAVVNAGLITAEIHHRRNLVAQSVPARVLLHHELSAVAFAKIDEFIPRPS